MTNSKEEPIACSCCGKKPDVRWNKGFSYVICKRCRRATGLYKDWDEPGDSKDDAIRAWNASFGLYTCDPEKNTGCTKEGCFVNGGSCMHTTKKEASK